MSSLGQQRLSREDYKKAKGLEELRKTGAAPPELDEEGNMINPHIPQYIAQSPWYLNNSRPGLKHQKATSFKRGKEGEPPQATFTTYYQRGHISSGAAAAPSKFIPGSCTNCGSTRHKAKDCYERPRKKGAALTGKDTMPAEHIQELSFSYDAKRDRWNGYDPNHYSQVIKRFERTELERKKAKLEELDRVFEEKKKRKEEEEKKKLNGEGGDGADAAAEADGEKKTEDAAAAGTSADGSTESMSEARRLRAIRKREKLTKMIRKAQAASSGASKGGGESDSDSQCQCQRHQQHLFLHTFVGNCRSSSPMSLLLLLLCAHILTPFILCHGTSLQSHGRDPTPIQAQTRNHHQRLHRQAQLHAYAVVGSDSDSAPRPLSSKDQYYPDPYLALGVRTASLTGPHAATRQMAFMSGGSAHSISDAEPDASFDGPRHADAHAYSHAHRHIHRVLPAGQQGAGRSGLAGLTHAGLSPSLRPVTVAQIPQLPPDPELCPFWFGSGSDTDHDQLIPPHIRTPPIPRNRYGGRLRQRIGSVRRRSAKSQSLWSPPPPNSCPPNPLGSATCQWPPLPANSSVVTSLMDFYTRSGGETWRWDPSKGLQWGRMDVSPCQWQGIGCDSDGSIVSINLSSMRVQGWVPNLFSALINLTHLDLSRNCLYSTGGQWLDFSPFPQLQVLILHDQYDVVADLPHSFFTNLPRLRELDLSFLAVTSSIKNFGLFTRLEKLGLQGVSLSGQLSDFAPLAPTLQVLELNIAQMQPGEMWHFPGFTQLFFLQLPGLPLFGRVPDINHLVALNEIDLSRTQLTGPLPTLHLPLLTAIDLEETPLSGGLDPLYNCTNLQHIDIGFSGLSVDLDSLCSHFPSLSMLYITYPPTATGRLKSIEACTQLRELTIQAAYLTGNIPDLRYLTQLTALDLSFNQLIAPLPTFAGNALLGSLVLSNNRLGDDADNPLSWLQSLPASVTWVEVANNGFTGPLPTLMTVEGELPQKLGHLDLSGNEFTGSIPQSYTQLPALTALMLGGNRLTGCIPSFNKTTPPQPLQFLILDDNQLTCGIPPMQLPYLSVLNVARNLLSGPLNLTVIEAPYFYLFAADSNNFSCPVLLPSQHTIQFLHIANNSFNASCGGIDSFILDLPHLQMIDASFNDWTGSLPTYLPQEMRSFQCQQCGLDTQIPGAWAQIPTLNSLFLSGNRVRGTLEQVPTYLQILDLSLCEMEGSAFSAFTWTNVPTPLPGWFITILDMSWNGLSGHLSHTIFDRDVPGYNFVTYLLQLKVGHNNLTGSLPEATPGWDITVIDFSYNNFQGYVPDSYVNFRQLRELRLEGNPGLRAPPGRPLPSFLTTAEFGVTTSSSAGVGWSCPALRHVSNPGAIVTLDPSYYDYQLCECVDKYFGKGNQCQLCPSGACQCSASVIEGCYPVPVGGLGAGSGSGLTLSKENSGTEFFVILPCPLSILGQSLCNPLGLPWPGFAPQGTEVDLPTFCVTGHQGRLCSQCKDGYFASGRWCLRCLPDGLHAFIWLACMALLVGLTAFLYIRVPMPHHLLHAMQQLEERGRAGDDLSGATTERTRSSGSVSATTTAEISNVMVDNLRVYPRPSLVLTAISVAGRNESASWKLLVFHCQCLSILLLTQTSLPSPLVSFISVVSSGSGFSLSSLLAVECVFPRAWGLAHQIWASLVPPAIVVIGAALAMAAERKYLAGTASRSANVDSSSRQVDSQALLLPSPFILRVWRWYAVCWSLLYVLVFPSVQLSLSSIGCTDWREGGDPYLNLLPWIRCDANWRRDVLPPALLSLIFWIVIFPSVTTLLLMRFRSQLLQTHENKTTHPNLASWTVVGQMVAPYRPGMWLWEQVVLLRRIALLVVVAVVPAYSVSLPLLLFTLIQLSTLLQHSAMPWTSVWDSRAELASLYLLLINYITALVMHESSSSGGARSGAATPVNDDGLSLNAWAFFLLVINVAYIILLMLSISERLRRRIVKLITSILAASRPVPVAGVSPEAPKADTDASSHTSESEPDLLLSTGSDNSVPARSYASFPTGDAFSAPFLHWEHGHDETLRGFEANPEMDRSAAYSYR